MITFNRRRRSTTPAAASSPPSVPFTLLFSSYTLFFSILFLDIIFCALSFANLYPASLSPPTSSSFTFCFACHQSFSFPPSACFPIRIPLYIFIPSSLPFPSLPSSLYLLSSLTSLSFLFLFVSSFLSFLPVISLLNLYLKKALQSTLPFRIPCSLHLGVTYYFLLAPLSL